MAARNGIHVEGYDCPAETPAKADALNDDKADKPVVGCSAIQQEQLGWVTKCCNTALEYTIPREKQA